MYAKAHEELLDEFARKMAFDFSPRTLHAAWLDGERHTKMTGSLATVAAMTGSPATVEPIMGGAHTAGSGVGAQLFRPPGRVFFIMRRWWSTQSARPTVTFCSDGFLGFLWPGGERHPQVRPGNFNEIRMIAGTTPPGCKHDRRGGGETDATYVRAI